MTTPTKRDAIEAAMNIADDVAQGRLDPAALDAELVAACQEVCGTVVGPDDPLWPLQVQIARGVLAAGGIPTDELSEWLAVQRRRENPDGDTVLPAADGQGGAGAAEGADVLTVADLIATEPHSAEYVATPADAAVGLVEVLAAPAAEPEPQPETSAGCKCASAPIHRGPKFGGTVLAVGRGVPVDTGLRPL